MNQDNYNEIDFVDLFFGVWNKKILVICITTFFAAISVSYSLSLPNIYTSSALLASTSKEESLSGNLGNYSSFAGMAGINLSSGSSDKSIEAIERIKSYDFFIEQFLPNIEFQNLVAADAWSPEINEINYNQSIFNKNSGKWIEDKKPSHQEAFIIYNEMLEISKNKRTSFTLIKVEHISPIIAKKWTNLIIRKINSHMRVLDRIISESSINYLTKEYNKSNLSELKQVVGKLVQSEIQTLMLIEVTDDYIFNIISSPIAPENKSGPSRALICILGSVLGFIISILTALMLHLSDKRKTLNI